MHYFRGPEDANKWLTDHPGLAVLSVYDAYSLIREILIDPLLSRV